MPPIPHGNRLVVVVSTTHTNSAVKTISTRIVAPRLLKPSRSHPLEANPPRSKPSRLVAIRRMMRAPMMPPITCPIHETIARPRSIFFVNSIPSVMAGLM